MEYHDSEHVMGLLHGYQNETVISGSPVYHTVDAKHLAWPSYTTAPQSPKFKVFEVMQAWYYQP